MEVDLEMEVELSAADEGGDMSVVWESQWNFVLWIEIRLEFNHHFEKHVRFARVLV